MTNCKYLVDTVILIEHFNNHEPPSFWLSHLKKGEAAISPITFAEVLTGAVSEKEETDILSILESFIHLDVHYSTARLAAQLRRNWHWKLPDAFQAALSIEHQLSLCTRNAKDFSSQKHPFVQIPY